MIAVLADFGTVTEALACATSIQRELASRNQDLPDERKVQFRIGVNLGEVIVDRDDIYGDGVNVAARLESLAEPGGICISDAVRSAVGKKLDLDYEDMGEQQVKNIAEAVRACRVMLKEKEQPVITSGEAPALDLPDKPSIAVLPFTNISGDPEQDLVGDGMTEEITTALSWIADLFVIARNSTFVYKGRAVNVGEVGWELGVRYVLEGSVRTARNRVRVTTQLIEADTGIHLWAERYDRKLNDIFAVQDEIAREVTIALQGKLLYGESVAYQRGTRNFGAWQLCMRGVEAQLRFNRGDNMEARRYLEEAVALAPEYEGALVSLAWADFNAARLGFTDAPVKAIQRVAEIVGKLLGCEPAHADGLILKAMLLLLQRDHNAAIDAGVRAAIASPNDATIHACLALIFARAGRPDDSLPRINYAMRLSPYCPGWFLPRSSTLTSNSATCVRP